MIEDPSQGVIITTRFIRTEPHAFYPLGLHLVLINIFVLTQSSCLAAESRFFGVRSLYRPL